MHIAATPDQARAILAAMLTVASSGRGASDADRASIAAAARCIFKFDAPTPTCGAPAPISRASSPPTPNSPRRPSASPR